MLKISNVTIDNAVIFGNVTVKKSLTDKSGNAPIAYSTAIRLVYVLEPDLKEDDWLRQFVISTKNLKYENASLYVSTSCSLPDEMERNGALLIPWIPWMVVVLLGFCMVVCSSSDAVRSQPFIGIASMINASLAVITACATLIILRYPFLHMVLIMPFLVICEFSIIFITKLNY
uniref:SSD domain-containing protein n=1 Tax=Steinernema glaseri TaxID=37863 RepID=A0A1I8A8M3_9BILA